MKEQVMVYSVAASANANAISLTSADKQYFYWNDKTFKSLNIGDYVFVVNVAGKKVLFTTLDAIDISTNVNNEGNTYFTDLNTEYIVSGKYEKFIRLKIISDLYTPTNWEWKSLGSSETTYLNGPRINKEKSANRTLNINQLKELSPEENYNRVLNACLLNFGTLTLLPEIQNAIATAHTQDLINNSDFHFQKAKDTFNEFEAVTYSKEFYADVLEKYKKSTISFDKYALSFPENTDEGHFLRLLATLVSYCDLSAAGKKTFNQYADYRVLARAFVRMGNWIENLVRYKINNDKEQLADNIYNALEYLKNSNAGITILSENHKKLISENLIGKDYNHDTFIADLINFFAPYSIKPKNANNLTAIFSSIIYDNAVKTLWISEGEIVPEASTTNLELLCAIKTKPFVLLAGLSGTGKSREVRALAYQFCTEDLKTENNGKPNNFELIKVKPNWHDSTELLGYESRITGTTRYIATDFIRFLVKAWKHIDTPFFLCLDEMNLAPVEQYFAEFLSVIETRQKDKNNNVITDSLINAQIFTEHNNADFWKSIGLTEQDEDIKTQLKTNGLCIPQNLIVIGTVNMDETTHSFSRKVLDRAMTIEMNTIDLNSGLEKTSNTWIYPLNPSEASLVVGNYTLAKDVIDELGENTKVVIDYLEAINNILSDSPFKIAYRVRDEFLIYLTHFLQLNDNVNQALDNMTLMKILPRIEGDETKTKVILKSLLNASETEELTNTKTKVSEMLKKLDNYHYTSFWN